MAASVRPTEDLGHFRLGYAAALVGLAIPLLPVYGTGHLFIFSMGVPLRSLIGLFLTQWTPALLAGGGIWVLARGRSDVASGIFGAAALMVAFRLVAQLLETAPHFAPWQTDLVLALELVEAVLLALAAGQAVGASGEGERRSHDPSVEGRGAS